MRSSCWKLVDRYPRNSGTTSTTKATGTSWWPFSSTAGKRCGRRLMAQGSSPARALSASESRRLRPITIV